jgi:hypothetical protein
VKDGDECVSAISFAVSLNPMTGGATLFVMTRLRALSAVVDSAVSVSAPVGFALSLSRRCWTLAATVLLAAAPLDNFNLIHCFL